MIYELRVNIVARRVEAFFKPYFDKEYDPANLQEALSDDCTTTVVYELRDGLPLIHSVGFTHEHKVGLMLDWIDEAIQKALPDDLGDEYVKLSL